MSMRTCNGSAASLVCSFWVIRGVSLFLLELDKHARVVLGELKKKQIIFEAETLAAVTAFIL